MCGTYPAARIHQCCAPARSGTLVSKSWIPFRAPNPRQAPRHHPLQQRPVGCFSSLLIHNFQILGSASCQLREVPSQLTGAPQSNDWREVAGAQGLCCRGRNGARSKVPGAVVSFPIGNTHFPIGNRHRLDSNWEQGTWEHPVAWEHFGNWEHLFRPWEHREHSYDCSRLGTLGNIFLNRSTSY